ncbi:hypothetical protein JCM16307_10850 [Thermococcus prieurii]
MLEVVVEVEVLGLVVELVGVAVVEGDEVELVLSFEAIQPAATTAPSKSRTTKSAVLFMVITWTFCPD